MHGAAGYRLSAEQRADKHSLNGKSLLALPCVRYSRLRYSIPAYCYWYKYCAVPTLTYVRYLAASLPLPASVPECQCRAQSKWPSQIVAVSHGASAMYIVYRNSYSLFLIGI